MRRFLRTEFATTLPRFDLMAALARAPDELTMGELSRRLMVSGGNVTSIVAGLERDGLIARRSPAADRRTSYVALTERGPLRPSPPWRARTSAGSTSCSRMSRTGMPRG